LCGSSTSLLDIDCQRFGHCPCTNDAGGLMAYHIDEPELLRLASGYVDKILKGAKPSDQPVQQETKFKLFINLKTAKGLGITIPQPVLAQADELIE
jgi:putative ABC transport system substrate-binding protein